MFKRWFDFAFIGNGASANGGTRPENHGLGLMEMGEEGEHPYKRPLPSGAAGPPEMAGFDQIYQNAAVKPPPMAYGILKVMSMADSPYLAGITPEAKRCALLMALEAAGAEIEDLLQDFIVILVRSLDIQPEPFVLSLLQVRTKAPLRRFDVRAFGCNQHSAHSWLL